MVAKIRKLMPKKKEKGDVEKIKIEKYLDKKPKNRN